MICLVFPAQLSLLSLQILGLVENMSCFKCPKCGEESYIFGEGGAQRTAEEMDMKLLGEVSGSSLACN
jgi:ATP-binding protein involved in chromosome partitioning